MKGYWRRLEESWLSHHPTYPSRGSALAQRASRLRKNGPVIDRCEQSGVVEPGEGLNDPMTCCVPPQSQSQIRKRSCARLWLVSEQANPEIRRERLTKKWRGPKDHWGEVNRAMSEVWVEELMGTCGTSIASGTLGRWWL